MIIRRSLPHLVSTPLALAALGLAAPLAACDLDGLPGMHRYDPFARYSTGGAPVIKSDQSAPQSPPSGQTGTTAQRDRPAADAGRVQQGQPAPSEKARSSTAASPENKATFP
jgi:hypothetical protein